MTKDEIIKALEITGEIYSVYNKMSKIPLVRQDEESNMDYAVLYFDKEGAIEEAKKILSEDERNICAAMAIKNSEITKVLIDFLHYGIDEVKFYKDGNCVSVPISDMIRYNENMKDPGGNPYLFNKEAQLSMIYLVQQLVRYKKEEEIDRTLFAPIEEEAIRNIVKSSFYVVFTEANEESTDDNKDAEGDEPKTTKDKLKDTVSKDAKEKRFSPIAMRTKGSDALMLPIFTDMNELKKALKDRKEQIPYKIMTFREIADRMLPEGINLDGVIINPIGVALPLSKDNVKRLIRDPRFTEG